MFVIVVWFARFDFGGFRLGGLVCSGSGCCVFVGCCKLAVVCLLIAFVFRVFGCGFLSLVCVAG